MSERTARCLERCVSGSVLAGLVVATGVFAPPVQSYEGGKEGEREPALNRPALSIELSGDADRLRAGKEVEYTIALANNGSGAVRDVTLSQSLPGEMEVVSAGQASVRSENAASWQVSLPPGDKVERALRVRVTDDLGENAWRIATTACAQLEADGPPVVCATEANLLEPKESAGPGGEVAGEAGMPTPKVTAAAVVLGVFVAAILAPLFARRRGRAQSASR